MARRICRVGNRRTCIPKYTTKLLSRKPGQGAGYVGELPLVPIVSRSVITMAQRDGILVTWDRPMMVTCDIKDQISVIIDGAAPVHPASVVFDPTDPSKMGIIMATPFKGGQVVTWAYDDQGPCDLQEVRAPNTEADNQTYGVSNQIVVQPIANDFIGACMGNTDDMQLQVKGAGTPASKHTSVIYQPDHDGVFHAFPADQPVWRGGRYENGVVYDTDSNGNRLTPAPLLHYQPETTNIFLHSNDLADKWWTKNGGLTCTFDQVGLTGAPNTATLLKATSTTIRESINKLYDIGEELDDRGVTAKIYIRKQTAAVNYRTRLTVALRGVVTKIAYVYLNTFDGTYDQKDTDGVKVIDGGSYWIVYIHLNSSDPLNDIVHIGCEPAYCTLMSTSEDVTLTGSIIWLNLDVYIDKTIEEVENLGPIFTDGTAVSTDRIDYRYDISNLNNDSGAMFMEIDPAPGLIAGTFLSYETASGFKITDYTFNSISLPGIADTINKVGIRWSVDEGLMSIMVNDTWSADVTYSGKLADDFKLFTQSLQAAGVNCIRTWSGGHYDELKQAIDDIKAFNDGFDSGFK